MKSDLIFTDLKSEIDNQFVQGGWITVYRSCDNRQTGESNGVYCAIVRNTAVRRAMKKHSWDLFIGSGRPGFVFSFRDGKQKATYYRHSESGFETFIHRRIDFGNQEGYCEISEEFRLYYNLFEQISSITQRQYFRFDESGEKELVAEIEKDTVRLQLRYLKNYISVRKCHFLVFFEGMRFSEKSPKELDICEIDEDIVTPEYVYNHLIRDISEMHIRQDKTQSWIKGKCLIKPIKGYKPSMEDEMSEPMAWEHFVIGYDSDGKLNEFTCNEEELSNNFGKNPDAPHYLTPVFFNLQVLNKYYENPADYEVRDGMVSRKGFWSLRLDNSLSEYVIVFLGDLGKLPHREQLYWKSFNIAPQGGMSRTGYKRSILGEWTNPEKADLYFKMRLSSFGERWREKYGWDLFLPLSKDDSHYLDSLHILLDANNIKEFDEQILSVVKIIIDSLNEKELAKHAGSVKEGAKGIDKLQSFLQSRKLNIDEMILFLRNVQTLRSTTVAHRRSRKANDKLSKYFQLDEKELRSIFEDIMVKMISVLNTLEHYLLKRPPVAEKTKTS